MIEAARLSVPLMTSSRKPTGKGFLTAEGRAEGRAFGVTVTADDIHFAFSEAEGAAFAIDLNHLVKTAIEAIDDRLLGQRRTLP